jgi:hypothetical protein
VHKDQRWTDGLQRKEHDVATKPREAVGSLREKADLQAAEQKAVEGEIDAVSEEDEQRHGHADEQGR